MRSQASGARVGQTGAVIDPSSLLLLVLGFGALGLKVWALVDACTRPQPAYVAAGKLTKIAWAGHPPPVLTVHGDPARLLAEASAPPLGVGLAHQHAANDTETLPPGAVLVAYSDGLVERRRTDIEEQLAALQRVVTAACDPAKVGTAKDIAADILNALVPDLDRAEDDVCVLVVMRRGPRAT